jgi:hypothetical protein
MFRSLTVGLERYVDGFLCNNVSNALVPPETELKKYILRNQLIPLLSIFKPDLKS